MGRIVLYISVLTVVFVACSKYKEPIDNLNGGKIWKFGHAGMGIGNSYPMNSRESLLKCLSYDVDGTELDVQLTKDNVLVAFHDELLTSKTDFTGRVNEYTWEELKNAVYDYLPNQRFQILRLTDLFEMTQTQNMHFAFDIKLYPANDNPNYESNFTNQLSALISTYNLESRCLVESPNAGMLNTFHVLHPEIEIYYYPGLSFEDGLAIALENNFDGITVSYKMLSKAKVKQAHNSGIKVITWDTQNKRENKLAVSYHPDIIETDEVRFLTRYVD